MIIDGPTGVELIPGNHGADCPGNPENGIYCCCDECDYLGCCTEYFHEQNCEECIMGECPRNENPNVEKQDLDFRSNLLG